MQADKLCKDDGEMEGERARHDVVVGWRSAQNDIQGKFFESMFWYACDSWCWEWCCWLSRTFHLSLASCCWKKMNHLQLFFCFRCRERERAVVTSLWLRKVENLLFFSTMKFIKSFSLPLARMHRAFHYSNLHKCSLFSRSHTSSWDMCKFGKLTRSVVLTNVTDGKLEKKEKGSEKKKTVW